MEIIKCLAFISLGLLQAFFLRANADDVVYSAGQNYGPAFTVPVAMETTPSYSDQDDVGEDSRLNCFDCTSYMPECKRIVSDREGLIVSRAGCKSKCFLRVGEEKSGALYRGCMDDFVSAKLSTDYVGCKVQEWNGRKTLWCLCDDDLCNGESLKSLFYYGYGKGSATVAFEEPAETAYLEPISSVDAEFNQMTGSLDNYNHHYALEPKEVEKATLNKIEDVVEEPIVTPTPEYMEPMEEPEDELEQETDQLDTQFREEFHQPDPHYFPPEQMRYVTEPEDVRYQQEGEEIRYSSEPDQLRYSTEQRLPEIASTERYPVPSEYTSDPTNGGQYPPPPPYEVPVTYYYPQPAFHPYLSPFSPHLNTYLKHPDTYGPPPPPMGYTKHEEESMAMPEGKAGVPPYAPYDKFGPIPPQDYQYSYQEGPADFELEPVSYFPYEAEKQRQFEEGEQLRDNLKAPEPEESQVTQEEAPKDMDTDLYCPSAGIFTYEEDCSKFVMCLIDHLKGRPRMYIMKCPGGLVFDSRANTCMKPEMSDGCQRLPEEDRRDAQPYYQSSTTLSPQIENMVPYNEDMVEGAYSENNF